MKRTELFGIMKKFILLNMSVELDEEDLDDIKAYGGDVRYAELWFTNRREGE